MSALTIPPDLFREIQAVAALTGYRVEEVLRFMLEESIRATRRA